MVRLTKGAKELLVQYMIEQPKIKRQEKIEHKVDPINNSVEFFEAELREPYHKTIKSIVREDGGRVTKRTLAKWIVENSRQHGTLVLQRHTTRRRRRSQD